MVRVNATVVVFYRLNDRIDAFPAIRMASTVDDIPDHVASYRIAAYRPRAIRYPKPISPAFIKSIGDARPTGDSALRGKLIKDDCDIALGLIG